MRIHSISLRNFRAVDRLEIADLPDTGVIVVHGCNEAGKSTIVDAIDLVLRERHSASGKKIKIYAPAGKDAGPEVTLSATVGETRFTIHKRWLKAKAAELTIHEPRHQQFTGREADDKLQQILRENMDIDLAKVLFLRQGELDPGIAAAGIPSISRALDSQSGETGAGEEDTALMQAIEAEYARYWTASTPPKEKASYKAQHDAVTRAKEVLEQRQHDVDALAGFVDEVARRQQEIARIDTELPGASEELTAREAELAVATKLRETADQADEALAAATRAMERATEDVATRESLEQRVTQLREEEDELQVSLGPATEARDAEQAKIAELSAAVDDAKARRAQARENVKRAERVRDGVRATRRLAEVEEHLNRIADAEQAYTELLERAPKREVSDKDVRSLEQAEAELKLQERLRDAASAKLEIAAEDEVLTVDGAQIRVQGSEAVALFDGTVIELGTTTMTFRAAQGAQDPREGARAALAAFQEQLEELGVESVEAARIARDAWHEHEAELTAARRRKADALAGSDPDDLRAQRATLAEQVEQAAGDHDEAGPVSEAEADGALRAHQDAVSAIDRELDTAEAALKPYADRKAAHDLTVIETQLEAKHAQVEAAAAELASAEERVSKAQLDENLAAARAQEKETAEEAKNVRGRLAEADPDFAEQLVEGAQVRLRNLEQRRADAHNRVVELTGRIELAEGAAEQADRAAASLEAAEAELERATRRAEAVKLLRDTMHAHRDAARARYAAPFTAAIRNRARHVFGPSVDFNLGDDLTVTDRTVDGVTVPLSELSGGAKEQLALLTRFAIADLVTESGSTTPVPVVVDDMLGATDPERLIRMNSLFGQVGQTSQVLVLTCFPDRFDRVPGATMIPIESLKQPG